MLQHLTTLFTPPPSPRRCALGQVHALLLCTLLSLAGSATAADTAHADAHASPETSAQKEAKAGAAGAAPSLDDIADRVRAKLNGVGSGKPMGRKNMTVQIKTAAGATAPQAEAIHDIPAIPGRLESPVAARQLAKAKSAATIGHETAVVVPSPHGAAAHWAYEGERGPTAWGKLNDDYATCSNGKRQSPINIEDANTLLGPAEPLVFSYQASAGSVVNNGHTIQVDVLGENTLTVRGSVFRLVQFHFHHPAEEQINFRGFSMVAHLVHKNAEGQLAVVAVLLEPGEPNSLINKVWTYMPLDTNDRVRMPVGMLDLSELLPKDQRYYQFMGSLTTPPCSENVLWMVLKAPTTISREQLRLFAQLFPNNARPVQAVNGRPVRNAQ